MRTHRSPGQSAASRRGTTVVIALIAVCTVFALCVGLLQISLSSTRYQNHASDARKAFYLSEAGLAEAYAGVTLEKTGNVGSPAAPAAIGGGVFWVEAEELGSDAVSLESTALYGSGRVTLGLVAQRQRFLLSSLGFFCLDDLAINPGCFIDSYDSDQGTYQEQLAAGVNLDQAIMGSNGDVSISSGAVLNGNLVYGTLGGFTAQPGAIVTGSTGARPAPADLPAIEVPAIPFAGALSVDDPAPLVLPSGEHAFESLEIRGGSQLVVVGPSTIVVGDLKTYRGATVTLDNRNGPIDLFATNDVDLGPGSVVATVLDDPGMVSLQVTAAGSNAVKLGADALFYGQIYAPYTTAAVSPEFEIFGSIASASLNIAANARMHLDLAILRGNRGSVLPEMWSWRVMDVPDAVASKGTDPMRVLGLDKGSLRPPARAHEDQELWVVYVDRSGATQEYLGPESLFDWSKVDHAIKGTRDGDYFHVVLPLASPKEAPQQELTPEEQLLVDKINSPLPSGELSAALAAEFPLTDNVLFAAINRTPSMDSWDLHYVIMTAGPFTQSYAFGLGSEPLSDSVLLAAIREPDFDSKPLSWVLDQNSPLPPEVLDAAINRDPPMKTADLNFVLRAQ